MQAQIVVLQLPPSDSDRSLVSLLSRNGTKLNGFELERAETQFERHAIDLLIVFASSKRIPSEPVFERRSDPAKSTTVSKALKYDFLFTLDSLLVVLITDKGRSVERSLSRVFSSGFVSKVRVYADEASGAVGSMRRYSTKI